jgi:hypothetical protein
MLPNLHFAKGDANGLRPMGASAANGATYGLMLAHLPANHHNRTGSDASYCRVLAKGRIPFRDSNKGYALPHNGQFCCGKDTRWRVAGHVRSAVGVL